MKKLHIFLLFCALNYHSIAQTNQFYIDTTVTISAGTIVNSAGSDLILDSKAAISNQGTWTVQNNNTALSISSLLNGTGNIIFNNSSNSQTIDANGDSIACNISINNPNNVNLNTLSTVTGAGNNNLSIGGGSTLTFTSGQIITNSSEVIFNAGSSYSGASNASHIYGTCVKVGNSAFTFPVGDADSLRAVGISAPALSTDSFTCQYFFSNPNALYNVSSHDVSLSGVSQREYWLISRGSSSTSPVKVTLSWLAPGHSGILNNISDLRVAHWDGNSWNDLGGSGTQTGNTSTGTVTTSSPVSSFSPFTLATTSIVNVLPIHIIDFVGEPKNGNVFIHWTYANNAGNQNFELMRSKDGTTWSTISTVPFVIGQSNYDFVDNDPYPSLNYYQLKEIDGNTGQMLLSSVILVQLNSSDNGIWVSPNPTYDLIKIRSTADLTNNAYYVIDLNGKIVMNGLLTGFTTTVDMNHLLQGTYYLKIGNKIQKLLKL
ncbi:MAG: T9SS type A sorting domain-containing protein [Bacteroidetes bacterium]|nr:T9SS type A sorting domain-containing protein [Bacteroidota bacterium]